MRVGLYLGDFRPTIGGGFTFVAAVTEAFLDHARSSSHEFTIFAEPSYLDTIRERARSAGVDVCAVRSGNLAKGAMLLRHATAPFSRLAGGGRLQRAADRRGIQFMWFVGGGAYDSLDVPYMATVWDVQHRTHPWFPEVAARGQWDIREIALARFLRRASRIITGTRVGAEQLGWYYQIPADRIVILPHPTPSVGKRSEASPRAEIAELANRPFILYPAQFWPHKNHANLLVALRFVRQSRPNLELVLTGSDKGNKAHVVDLTRQLGLSSCVHFLGFVEPHELAYLYQRALALTYVSWSGPENMPPLEAFSIGCPVINADFPGAREQLGEAARYVDPQSPRSIADGILDVLERSDERAHRIELGRKRAQSWTAADYVDGVFGILDEFGAIRACWK